MWNKKRKVWLLLLLASLIISMWSAFQAADPPERERYLHTLVTAPGVATEEEVALVWPGTWKPSNVWWHRFREVQVVQVVHWYIYPAEHRTLNVSVIHETAVVRPDPRRLEHGLLYVKRPYARMDWAWEFRITTKVAFKFGSRRFPILEREDIYRSPTFSPPE